ncbi:3'-kinase [Pseudomonas chlororaphis]|uniref:aminoglycoside phosphotransferase family protein n=1 Tax=Pseudomonas chlororaphis TaxID=587753 RepID=UPI00209B08F5|nr:aminoglycoside phosphotransferase family protein [Pseudomonas chlororaphis]MCO7574019.1 3'-kinase [Pseudomonas chlororaphis]MCO7592439.1 3'-kinase [Pseudomonas chlororaphis]
MFATYMERWRLTADGEPIVTPGSRLLPVRLEDGAPGMLKIALNEDEQAGNRLMAWWAGEGAAQVYAQEDQALLMERALGPRSLMCMALAGEHDAVSHIVCATLARLHAPRSKPLPALLPLDHWFKDLREAAHQRGGLLLNSLAMAEQLLAAPRDPVVLHGDVHHDNVLDFGEGGWRVIDPKRVYGERTFDFANLICNPDLPCATDPLRFARQVQVIARAAQLEPRRLVQWVLAFSGLSAAWFLQDDHQPGVQHQLKLAELAAQVLEG